MLRERDLELHKAPEIEGEAAGRPPTTTQRPSLAGWPLPPDERHAHSSRTAADFQATNHAVLIVGWGELGGTKYWWAQNTWGPHWASSGYFRMRRGGDDSAFESMVVAVDVEGALPLPSMQLKEESDDSSTSGVAVRGALRRLTFRRQQLWRALQTVDPTPQFRQVEQPRDFRLSPADASGAGADAMARPSSSHDPGLLDQLAHAHYGGE